MELLVTLRNFETLKKIKDHCDGIIVGSLFCSGYHYTIEDLKDIRSLCFEYNLKFYVVIDSFISEDDKEKIGAYLATLKDINVDGIYFHDLGIYSLSEKYNLKDKLIYDGQTVLCNSKEVAFYMSKGINGIVISRELTMEEITNIVSNNPQVCDLQVFGHLRLSYSKRNFLKNYFKEINREYNYFNKDSLYLVEEKRDYKMPIVEDHNGTKIYSDYVLEMFEEIVDLKDNIRRGIVDTLFLNEGGIEIVLDAYNSVNKNNCKGMSSLVKDEYPNVYEKGYLYQKTNITKDE